MLRRLALNILSFQAFTAINDFKVDEFALVQGLETVPEDGRVVDENVLTRLLSDEPEAFLVVKPLDAASGHVPQPLCRQARRPVRSRGPVCARSNSRMREADAIRRRKGLPLMQLLQFQPPCAAV